MNISIIILTINPDIKRLRSLISVVKDYELLVIDNTPDSDVQAEITRAIPSDKLFRCNRNVGYTGGMNIGLKKMFSGKSDWVILMNDDIKLTKKALEAFIRELKKCFPTIAGPQRGVLDRKRWTSIYPSSGKSFDYLSGSLLCIHRKVYDKIGGFYEPYFIYYEDVEYSIRALKCGFVPKYIATAINHKDGSSFKTDIRIKHYYLARNHLLFVERNAPWRVKLHELFRLPKTIWEHYQRREYSALHGIFDFIICKFGPYRRGLW